MGKIKNVIPENASFQGYFTKVSFKTSEWNQLSYFQNDYCKFTNSHLLWRGNLKLMYVLWPLAKKFQNGIVDRSTARDFKVDVLIQIILNEINAVLNLSIQNLTIYCQWIYVFCPYNCIILAYKLCKCNWHKCMMSWSY